MYEPNIIKIESKMTPQTAVHILDLINSACAHHADPTDSDVAALN